MENMWRHHSTSYTSKISSKTHFRYDGVTENLYFFDFARKRMKKYLIESIEQCDETEMSSEIRYI